MNIKKEKIANILIWVMVYAFFLVLWTRIHPVMVADADDWTYISFSRQALPAWKAWNPAKVFPETFMSLCGNIAAFIVYPIINDWSHAMTYTFAAVISIIVTAYIFLFHQVIERLFVLNKLNRYFVDFFFICSHFWVFKTSAERNSYMFMSHSLNTEMNYRVPMFIAATLLFYVIVRIIDEEKIKLGGCLLLWTYLTIFSNMATNIVIVIPVFLHFIYRLAIWNKKKEETFISFIKTMANHIIVFTMEIIVLIFEFFGGRASSLEFNFTQAVTEMLSDLKVVYKSVNVKFAIFVLALIIVSYMVMIKNKKCLANKAMTLILSSGVLSCIYMILLFTRVGDHKITRADNMSVMAIFFVIAGSIALGSILELVKKQDIFIPVIAYIMFFSLCNTGRLYGNYFDQGGNLYHGSHNGYVTAAECYEANTDIINQFIEADKAGIEEFDLYAPYILGQYEWTGARLETTLYRQGIIRRHMTVHMHVK